MAHLLIGGELALEQDEEPSIAEVEVGGLLALLRSRQQFRRLRRSQHSGEWQACSHAQFGMAMRDLPEACAVGRESDAGLGVPTRCEVSWGSRMAMRLLSATSCACIPLQSVWKLACVRHPHHALLRASLSVSAIERQNDYAGTAAAHAAAVGVKEDQLPAGLTSSFSMRQAKHQKASASSRMTHSSGAARSDMPCACNRASVKDESPRTHACKSVLTSVRGDQACQLSRDLPAHCASGCCAKTRPVCLNMYAFIWIANPAM